MRIYNIGRNPIAEGHRSPFNRNEETSSITRAEDGAVVLRVTYPFGHRFAVILTPDEVRQVQTVALPLPSTMETACKVIEEQLSSAWASEEQPLTLTSIETDEPDWNAIEAKHYADEHASAVADSEAGVPRKGI